MDTQQHIFRNSADKRMFRGEQAGGKEGLEDLGERLGGSMARSILVPQFTSWTFTFLRESASPCAKQLTKFTLPFK